MELNFFLTRGRKIKKIYDEIINDNLIFDYVCIIIFQKFYQ